jgi:four helix bundle protein
MDNNPKKPIKSFKDLDVYQRTYTLMVDVITRIVEHLPERERFDLKDQLSRSTKAIPRLIAEGYAKKHQKLGFIKYLDDALAECNETIVSLEQCCDLYSDLIDEKFGRELIQGYEIAAKQLYKLSQSWLNFKRREAVSL